MTTQPKRRRQGWLKTSLRNVMLNARTSVIVTVALLPSLLAQIFVYFNAVTPLQWIIGLALSMVAVFLLFLYLEWRAQPKDASGFIRDTLNSEQLSRIHGLVTVVSNMQKTDGTRAVQDLIRGLPSLQVVHCVTCDDDDGPLQLRLLREWIRRQGRTIDIRPLNTTPNRLKFDEGAAQVLGDELGFVQNPDRLVVDITADTKPMGLTLYLAGLQRGLPVTYFPSAKEGHPGEAFALSVIRDPHGFFGGEPAKPQ